MAGTVVPTPEQLPPGSRQMLGVPITGVQPNTKPGGFVRVTGGGKS